MVAVWYPFGVAIEIENKGDIDDASGNVQGWAEMPRV